MHFEFVSVELFKVEKYPKSRKVFKIFETDSKAEGIGKLEKVMEKVMELGELKGLSTNHVHSFICLGYP